MSYFKLFATHPRTLSFSLLFSFFSAPGQTFFLAFFLPFCIAELGLSPGSMSFLYASATLAAAAFLPWAGRWSDRSRPVTLALAATLLLGVSVLLLSISHTVWLLLPALVGVRFAGQGLFSHISQTMAARHDATVRGKALGVASLGYPLSEGILPILIALSIGIMGWRPTLTAVGTLILVLVVPFSIWLAPGGPSPSDSSAESSVPRGQFSAAARLWREPGFLINLPAATVFASLFTGLVLYHVAWAETRGWSPEWIAFCFGGFAICRVTAAILSGPWVDRFGARRIFALHLFPFIPGLIAAAFFEGRWVPLVFFLTAGLTAGLGGIAKTALWVELFGIKRIGEVRGLSASLQIVGTALGPIVLGGLYAWHGSVQVLFPAALVILLAAWIPALAFAFPRTLDPFWIFRRGSRA